VAARRRENRRGVAAHHRGESHQLVERLALHAQPGKQAGNLRIARAARKNFLHGGFRFGARQVFPARNSFQRRLNCERRARFLCHRLARPFACE